MTAPTIDHDAAARIDAIVDANSLLRRLGDAILCTVDGQWLPIADAVEAEALAPCENGRGWLYSEGVTWQQATRVWSADYLAEMIGGGNVAIDADEADRVRVALELAGVLTWGGDRDGGWLIATDARWDAAVGEVAPPPIMHRAFGISAPAPIIVERRA